jgi:prevent-host-death family protein
MAMKLSERIRPISYLKAHTARIIDELTEQRGTMVITQNGRARAVVQDIDTYEQTRESLAMLKLLAQSQSSAEAGKHKPLKKAFADITARTKNLP